MISPTAWPAPDLHGHSVCTQGNSFPLSASPPVQLLFQQNAVRGEDWWWVITGSGDLILDLRSSRPHPSCPPTGTPKPGSSIPHSSMFLRPHPCSEHVSTPGRQVWKLKSSLCPHEGLNLSPEIISLRLHPLFLGQAFLGIFLRVKVSHDLLYPNRGRNH